MQNNQSLNELERKRQALLSGALKRVRSATLAASLVPVATIAATPTAVYAQFCDPNCGGVNCPPPVNVPEPATLLLLAPAAAAVVAARRRQKKQE